MRCWIHSCGPRGSPRQGGRGEALPERGRVELLVPPPRPCPSSDLARCGASSRTGPSRRSSVCGEATPGAVALFAAVRFPQRVQPWRPTTTGSKNRSQHVGVVGVVLHDF